MTDRRPLPLGLAAFDLWTCLGRGTVAHVDAFRRSARGLRRVERPSGPACLGVIDGVPTLTGRLARYESRAASILAPLVDALQGPIAASGVPARRIGVAIATSTGGLDRTEAMLAGRPLAVPFDFERQHAIAALADLAAEISGAAGPRAVVSTACTSGAKVFALARRWMTLDLVDAVIVGAADGLCATTVDGFRSLSVLSEQACAPFSPTSPGMNVGEGGAAFLVVRGEAPVVVRGYGESSDAHHVAAPEPGGLGAADAIRAALAEAGLETIDHVNAHGTGTLHNDRAEALALARTVGATPLVASTKSATGHLLGAAGAVEVAFGALAIAHGLVPASIGAEPGPHLEGLRIAFAPTEVRVETVLSTSLAFGGSNTAIVLARGGVS